MAEPRVAASAQTPGSAGQARRARSTRPGRRRRGGYARTAPRAAGSSLGSPAKLGELGRWENHTWAELHLLGEGAGLRGRTPRATPLLLGQTREQGTSWAPGECGGPGRGPHPPQDLVPLQDQLAHMRHDALLRHFQVLLPRVGLAHAGLVQRLGFLRLGVGGADAGRSPLEGTPGFCTFSSGTHLSLGLLSRAPPPLVLLAGSWRGLGPRLLRGGLGARAQVLTALCVLQLGPAQRLHSLVLGRQDARVLAESWVPCAAARCPPRGGCRGSPSSSVHASTAP